MVFLSSNYATHSFSPLDVAHLTTAMHLSRRLRDVGEPHDIVMVVSDRVLTSASQGMGMDTFDPETDDPARLRPPSLELDE